MASEKIKGMMRGKNSPFTPEQLEAMTDKECWKWYFTNFPRKPKSNLPAICFTGFDDAERKQLEDSAKAKFEIVHATPARLKYLVTGAAPGPAKLEMARALNATILTEAQFRELLASGALPDITTGKGE